MMDVSQHSFLLNLSTHSPQIGLQLDSLTKHEIDFDPPPVDYVFTGRSQTTTASISNDNSPEATADSAELAPDDSNEPKTKPRVSAMAIIRRDGTTPISSWHGNSSSASNSDSEVNGMASSKNGSAASNPSAASNSSSAGGRKLSYHGKGRPYDRDTFLEQTKSRSWANLGGYDSLDRLKRKSPNHAPLDLKSRSDHRSLFTDTGTSTRSLPTKSDLGIKQDSCKRPKDPYAQFAQYAERLHRKASASRPEDLDSIANALRDRYAGTTSMDKARLKGQLNYEEVEEPSIIPSHIIQNSCQQQSRSVMHPVVKSILVKQTRRTSVVSFSSVEVRQYERILGDNPACSTGPPLTIGWKFDETKTINMSVDDYEYDHGLNRDETAMVLSRQEREEMLLELGYSLKEMAMSVRKNIRLKNRRRQTVNNLGVMKVEEMVETTMKKISNVFPGRHRKKKEGRMYKHWEKTDFKNDDDISFSSLKSCLKLGGSEPTVSTHSQGRNLSMRSISNDEQWD
jgi:hypothetical protein